MNNTKTKQNFPSIDILSGVNYTSTMSIASKLVNSNKPNRNILSQTNNTDIITQGELLKLSSLIADDKITYTNIIQLFPDMELAIQIIVSLIMSPKDMIQTNIVYSSEQNFISSSISSKIINVIEEEIKLNYNIEKDLPIQLRESLFESGAYIKLILPESTLDDLINNHDKFSTENFDNIIKSNFSKFPNLGYLSEDDINFSNFSIESFKERTNSANTNYNDQINYVTENLIVSDNFNILKIPTILDISSKLKEKKIANENYAIFHTRMKEDPQTLFKNANQIPRPFIKVKPYEDNARKDIDRPLIKKLPIESTIPVFSDDPRDPIGYFILIDAEGNPISTTNNMAGYLDNIASGMNIANNSIARQLTTRANQAINGSNISNVGLKEIFNAYANIVKSELLNKLKKGIYKKSLKLTDRHNIYTIMLSNALSNQYNRLIYVPAELVCYFAYDYHPNGVGKSLFSNIKMLSSLRGMLLVSQILGSVKNSIPLTEVNIELDPDEPDPMKVIDLISSEILITQRAGYPIGITAPGDLADFAQRAGLSLHWSGHPKLPDTKLSFEHKSMQHQLPDTDLMELLRKYCYMAVWLTPEQVDAAYTDQLATTVKNQNVMLNKRIVDKSLLTGSMWSKFVHRVSLLDPVIKKKCIDIFVTEKENIFKTLNEDLKKEFEEAFESNVDLFFDYLYELIIPTIELTLPQADSTTLTNLTDAFNEYEAGLDTVLDKAHINGDIISSDLVGEIGDSVDKAKAMIKASYLRKWQVDNGYYTEIFDMVSRTDEGELKKDIYNDTFEHAKTLVACLGALLKDFTTLNDKVTEVIEDQDINTGNAGSSYSSDSEDTGSSEDDMFGGDDEFNMGENSDTESEETSNDEDNNQLENNTTEEKEKPSDETSDVDNKKE